MSTGSTGIYHPQKGTTTINGGSITGANCGIEVRSGDITVNDGYITGEATPTNVDSNGNGTTSSGAGIAVAQHTTGLPINIVINGGNIEGYSAFYESNPENSTPEQLSTVNFNINNGTFTAINGGSKAVYSADIKDFIVGGTFKTESGDTSDVSDYISDDVAVVQDGNGTVITNTTEAVAEVDGVPYKTLQAAIDAAPAGGTVTLLKDIHPVVPDGATAGQSGAITINKNITIDGKNLQIIADDGSFTTTGNTGNFHVINVTGGNVTIKNLNIDGCDKARSGINVWGNGSANPTVTIEDTDIKDCTTYGVTIGSATVTADGLRTSGGGWGGVNVDTKKGNSSFTMESGTLADNYSVVVGEDEGYTSDVNLEGGNYSKIQVKISNTDIDISGGNYEDIEVIDGVNITDQISITGGTFEKRQPNTYVYTNYVAYNSTTGYTYTDNLSTAMNAAGQNGTVDYVAGNGWDVTLYYDKDVQTKIEVPDDYVFTLPGGTFEGKKIEGWKYGSEVFEPGDRDTITSDRTYYVILRTAAYDIVIDDDILHGDIWTSPRSEAEAGDTVHVYADPDAGYVLEDLSVTYRSGRNELKLTRVSANHYTFTMPARDVYVTAEFTSDGFPFDDVRSNQWFYDAVYYVWANDLMEGVDYDEFNPNGTMTRAMFWAVLGRIDGETITGSDWADEARDWAMSEGVSDGTDPNGLVTREQMVTMLWRYAGERDGSGNLSRYTDGDKVAQYATEAMRWALGNGIIEGTTATTLEPQATATRAQCAAIFMRYYE